MSSSTWARAPLLISPLADVMEARDPLRSLPPTKGARTDEAEGDGGSGGMPARWCASRRRHVGRWGVRRAVLKRMCERVSSRQKVAKRCGWSDGELNHAHAHVPECRRCLLVPNFRFDMSFRSGRDDVASRAFPALERQSGGEWAVAGVFVDLALSQTRERETRRLAVSLHFTSGPQWRWSEALHARCGASCARIAVPPATRAPLDFSCLEGGSATREDFTCSRQVPVPYHSSLLRGWLTAVTPDIWHRHDPPRWLTSRKTGLAL